MGSWGKDLDPPLKLSTLIKTILAETDIPRLRLSSLEPWDINREFFGLWQNPRLANHLHLPLQSGSTRTLKRMARKTTPEAYAALLENARNEIEDLAVTTDIITGFPGESEGEFQESLVFIEKMAFARGHVFTFSERKGTAAARMPGSVPYPLRKSRNAQVQRVLARSEQAFRERFLGSLRPVLWEKATWDVSGRWILSGLTDNYLRVKAAAQENKWNQISKVRLTGLNDSGMVAEIVETGSTSPPYPTKRRNR
jgi:threonylcarbamoyladenosine tRNA methylthiotransferase MtaB